MPKGYLSMVLHAHLPYVRHPEYNDFLEEDWLYEAITETYIPLLDMFERLTNDIEANFKDWRKDVRKSFNDLHQDMLRKMVRNTYTINFS